MPYLIFDIETIRDKEFIIESFRQIGGSETPETPDETWYRFLAYVGDKHNGFPPHQYHVPVVICAILLDDNTQFLDCKIVASMDIEKNTKEIWDYFSRYSGTTMFVHFNGLKFDFPVLETMALKYDVPIPWWFQWQGKRYEIPRRGEETSGQLDLMAYLSPWGRTIASMHVWSKLIGLPGKKEETGKNIDLLVGGGLLSEVVDYCLTDVLNTTGILLRVLNVAGAVINPGAPWTDNYAEIARQVVARGGSQCALWYKEYTEALNRRRS